MKTLNIIAKAGFFLLIILCLLSFVLFIYFNELLDIQKVVLKEGIFKIVNKENDFNFDNLRSEKFDLIIKFHKDKNIDYSDFIMDQIPYTIDIELKELGNRIIQRDTINQNSQIPKSYANDYIDWTLLHFNAEKGKKYEVKFIFRSNYKNFDTMKKEIYLMQHYDYAGKPVWFLFRIILLSIFIITLLAILIIGIIYRWKKTKYV